MGYLKKRTVTIDGIGELEITELSSAAQVEMLEAKDKPYEGLFIACRHGAWPDKSSAEVSNMLTMRMVNDVAAAVFELSGITSGNSASGQGDDSSTA